MFSGLDDNEILRYLRCEAEPRVLDDIKRIRGILFENASPRHVCARFGLESTETGIHVKNTGLTLTGNDIREFLHPSGECYLAAATLGAEADRTILYVQRKSSADGLIIDAVASAAIEYYMDGLQRGLSGEPLKRYSCGYGDLPITLQPDFLLALNAQKAIGLYCNKQNIMTPRKSITAIITKNSTGGGAFHDCGGCGIKCEKRKAGEFCGR